MIRDPVWLQTQYRQGCRSASARSLGSVPLIGLLCPLAACTKAVANLDVTERHRNTQRQEKGRSSLPGVPAADFHMSAQVGVPTPAQAETSFWQDPQHYSGGPGSSP